MQNLEVKECYLCHRIGNVEVHHCIHGTANRRLAEKDGLMVNLCPDCHRRLHDKGEGDDFLKRTAQAEWIIYNRATTGEWIARYGKNFIYKGCTT